MKLYEFTITDKYNLPESEIQKIAEDSAAEEALLEGWADYKLVRRPSPGQAPAGERHFVFEVHGTYRPSQDDDEDDVASPQRGSARKPDVAAKA